MQIFVKLSGVQPLVEGSQRRIYAHPLDPDLLIKVARPEAVERYRARSCAWYQHSRRLRHWTSSFRELREQMALFVAPGRYPPHLQKFLGFVETDLGMGELVEAKRAADGSLAPTLRMLLRTGRYDAEAEEALQRFLHWLLNGTLMVTDLNPGNLVYAADPLGNEFTLIDGYGGDGLMPYLSVFRLPSTIHKKRKIAQLLAKMEKDRSRGMLPKASPSMHPQLS